MRRIAFGGIFVVVVVLAACVGDDPVIGGASSGTATDGGTTPGTTCSATSPCATGTCVDGFCCDSPCGGTCEACNLPGLEGKCSPVSGPPRRGKCDGDTSGPCAGTCDGKIRAACTYPEVACGAGSCAGGVAKPAPKCSAGTCPATTPQTCALGCFEDGCLGVKQVAANRGTTCVVLTDKHVRCWGANDVGQTGRAPSLGAVIATPEEVAGIANAEAIAASGSSFCALLTDKTVKCWGGNQSGELGQGGAPDTSAHPVPATVTGLTDATFIGGSSGAHFCAIVGSAGEVKCWGANSSGQLGDNTPSTARTSPTSICAPDAPTCPTPSSKATFVAGGDNYTCGIFDGVVACWGANDGQQLGNPNVGAASAKPTKISPPLPATSLTAGNALTCAVSAGGAKCWGRNFGVGRLGNGVADSSSTATPTSVCTKQDCSTLLAGATGVTTYDESVCAVAGGAVKCWGSNSGGQLGDGTSSTFQAFAATNAIGAGAVAVASGGGANYAIVVDGANRNLRCWGQETSSQCGTGTPNADRRSPVVPKW